MTQKNTVIEYPTGLSAIPYASFLQIEKYSYDEAQKTVAKTFNDANGSYNRSVISDAVRFGSNRLAEAYGSGAPQDNIFGNFTDYALNEYKTEKVVTKEKRGKRTFTKTSGGKTINITDPNVDPSTRVQLKNGEVTTVGQLLQKKQDLIDKKNKGLMAERCMLPLPNEFQYKYGADWNNEFKLGTLALAADEAGKFASLATVGGIAGAGMEYATSKLTKGANVAKIGGVDTTKLVQGFTKGAKGATDPFKVNSELNPKNLAGLAGLAPNENAITMFSKMQNRTFSLTFEFLARDVEEADNIDKIINGFKTGMHPTTTGKGTGGVLGFPDIFMLEPWYGAVDAQGNIVPNGQRHPMMPRSKLVALTSLNVNASPSNNFVTTRDGKLPFQTVTMEFSETTALTQSDLESGTF